MDKNGFPWKIACPVEDQMNKEQALDNGFIFIDPFGTGMCSESNGSDAFTFHPHLHSKYLNQAFSLGDRLLTNRNVQPIVHTNFQSQQPTSTPTVQPLSMIPHLDQNIFQGHWGVSRPEQEIIPGLGQTDNVYLGYSWKTAWSDQHASASRQNIFDKANPAPQMEGKCHYTRIEQVKYKTTKFEDKLSMANKLLKPRRNITEELEQLLNLEIDSAPKTSCSTSASFPNIGSLSLLPPHLQQHTTTSFCKHGTIPALPANEISLMQANGSSSYKNLDPLPQTPTTRTEFTSPKHTTIHFDISALKAMSFNGNVPTPTKFDESLTTPQKAYTSPTFRPSTRKSRGRHHRTATPEQQTIREFMGGKPVFTMGMKEQDDRCLLFDFFQQIKHWATDYTVHLKSLDAEHIHGLANRPAIAGGLGESSKLSMLVTENDMLSAMIASIICRHIVTHAMDEHALHASGHPRSDTCEALAYRWSLLGANDYAAKQNLLLSQQQIYTKIKEDPNHRSWRAATASRLVFALISSLSGLLTTSLRPATLIERNHILTEIYIKGYRIGFRLRMAASRWSFQWPLSSAEFDPTAMVNESRLLYGDILRTMTAVMSDPRAHEVRFAVSPTVARSDFGKGGENRVVAHHAMVHITPKGCD
ncbi:hypothetical protein IAQ61_005262 [Plenodomus lingam]|uniref:uncharacterized protein n=1 Tax=Leptosphaeria maculans TaxID=5022 RepID=UPI00331C7640|nr:hypothetical protein IAQ61_005262 [Plenodomus lingam]